MLVLRVWDWDAWTDAHYSRVAVSGKGGALPAVRYGGR
jgi:hypothetical protein